MTKKLQQFFIYKISSVRLREKKYKLELSLDEARKNQEIVSISDSQLVRTIHKITNHTYSQFELDQLLLERKRISKRNNSKTDRKNMKTLSEKIDNLLFIPEIISVYFSDKRHAKKIMEQESIKVNKIEFLPFMASSGMIRRNTMLFIKKELYSEVLRIFENSRLTEKEFVPAKYGTYFSLYSSSSIDVTFPNIAIVPDKIIKTTRRVDFSTTPQENFESFIQEKEMELELNAFDGQGLVSPRMAKIWSQNLELDYVPSCFIVRSSFLKGVCVTFDFHLFAQENNVTTFLDIYGNGVRVKDIDVIISESQFKLWNAYLSTEDYIQKCKENDLGWGITRFSPKEEKDSGFSSYQFIQSLDIKENNIPALAEPTYRWLADVSGLNVESALLYTLGEMSFEEGWFGRLEPNIQAFLLDNSLINDSYFTRYFDKNIKKRKNDARMGRLIFPANYQFMISDPCAQCCHVFDLPFNSLLAEGECYSHYWNNKAGLQIGIVRSPIVHHSEVNCLNLANSPLKEKWYKHITSGIIFPPYGVSLDMAILGGADVDGDICFSTNYKPFIDGRIKSLPIFYDTQTAIKKSVNDLRKVLESQLEGLGTKVGFLTNIGSTLASMLNDYDKESFEYKILSERYKYIRVAQGLEIDKQKGLIIPEFPKWWTRRKKITEDMSEMDKIFHRINNGLVIDKRPHFFKFLYEHMGKNWKDEVRGFDNISRTKYNISLKQLENFENKSVEQIRLFKEYKDKSNFVDNDSVMNRVSHYLEHEIKNIPVQRNSKKEFDYTTLLSVDYKKPNKENLEKMRFLFKEYKSLKRALRSTHSEYVEKDFTTLNQIKSYINKKAYSAISSNGSELADLATVLCYIVLGKTSKSFLWDCFGKEVVENVLYKTKAKSVRVPIKKKDGKIEYLFSNYSMYQMGIA